MFIRFRSFCHRLRGVPAAFRPIGPGAVGRNLRQSVVSTDPRAARWEIQLQSKYGPGRMASGAAIGGVQPGRTLRNHGAGALLFCLVGTWAVAATPSRADWLRSVEEDISQGSGRSLVGAVLEGQRDVEPLALGALGDPDPNLRLVAAACLWRLGDRGDEVIEAIRTGMLRVESDPRTTREVPEAIREAMIHVALVLVDDRPVPGWRPAFRFDDPKPGGAYLWEWWARYQEDFR